MLHIARLEPIAVAVAAALALGACDGTRRAGGEPARATTLLRLANGNANPEELQVFVDRVAKLSKGRLRIQPVNAWRKGQTRYETGLIEDVKAGKADLGWAGSRVWSSVGVKAFEPLHAPFVIDSYELESGVLSGYATTRMLAALRRIGLAGVAVLPGPLQYLQLDRRIDGPAGLAGLRIGYYASPLHEAALRALGARAVAIPSGGSIGGLNGVGAHASTSFGLGYLDTANYIVADAPLWPRPLVVFAGSERWASLPKADRDIIVRAAEQARGSMLVMLRERERLAVAGMCKAGGHLVDLGAAGWARMRHEVEPLLSPLRDDPATRDGISEIEMLRRDRGPHSVRCPHGTSVLRGPLSGVYETTMRRTEKGAEAASADWEESGADAIRAELELSDGRADVTLYYPRGPIPGSSEKYSIFRDVITFERTAGTGHFTARWTLEGKRLRLTELRGEPAEVFIMGRTWTRTR